jgi:hypothetical protein
MKRIAAPMVGGILTSFLLELLVYPGVYQVWKWHYELKQHRAGIEPGEIAATRRLQSERVTVDREWRTHQELDLKPSDPPLGRCCSRIYSSVSNCQQAPTP